MSPLLPILAALDENDQMLLKNMARSGWSQMTIIMASLGAVAALVFLFVFIFRKRLFRKRKRHHHEHRSDQVAPDTITTDEDSGRRGKKRRRSRQHRTLNPTLAQTRGLPPMREEGKPPQGL